MNPSWHWTRLLMALRWSVQYEGTRVVRSQHIGVQKKELQPHLRAQVVRHPTPQEGRASLDALEALALPVGLGLSWVHSRGWARTGH